MTDDSIFSKPMSSHSRESLDGPPLWVHVDKEKGEVYWSDEEIPKGPHFNSFPLRAFEDTLNILSNGNIRYWKGQFMFARSYPYER